MTKGMAKGENLLYYNHISQITKREDYHASRSH